MENTCAHARVHAQIHSHTHAHTHKHRHIILHAADVWWHWFNKISATGSRCETMVDIEQQIFGKNCDINVKGIAKRNWCWCQANAEACFAEKSTLNNNFFSVCKLNNAPTEHILRSLQAKPKYNAVPFFARNTRAKFLHVKSTLCLLPHTGI